MQPTLGRDFLDRFSLDRPVVQAGMAGGVARGELAGAVSAAGALGTVGMMAPRAFAAALADARRRAPGRSVAANLLIPFIRRAHLHACFEAKAALVVLHGGLSLTLMGRLRERGVAVFVTVGTREEALRALSAGADGLVLQGSDAGGHLLGVKPLEHSLAGVLDAASRVPVLAAGGVADAQDVQRLLDAGASAAVAGTRFLLTDESAAHPIYKRRLVAADQTLATLLFGIGWPLRHRVIPNRATERWCANNELGPRPVRAVGRLTAALGRAVPLDAMGALAGRQRAGIPLFTPALPVVGMPDKAADSTALYAGETVSRLHDIIPAAQAVAQLTPADR
jgi:NAD(P)H-dependent flavin oxidoreductase YrpB (nitropropane dioxygenase family)